MKKNDYKTIEGKAANILIVCVIILSIITYIVSSRGNKENNNIEVINVNIDKTSYSLGWCLRNNNKDCILLDKFDDSNNTIQGLVLCNDLLDRNKRLIRTKDKFDEAYAKIRKQSIDEYNKNNKVKRGYNQYNYYFECIKN